MGNIELVKIGMLVSAHLVLARYDVGWRWGEDSLIDSYHKEVWKPELLVPSRSANQLSFYGNKHL